MTLAILLTGVADDDFEEALQGTWANNPTIVVMTADTEISDVSATTLTAGLRSLRPC